MTKGEEIEIIYKTSFNEPFPLKECVALAHAVGRSEDCLVTDLDLYFAYLAGYASSASRLCGRPTAELQSLQKKLHKDIYQQTRELESYRGKVRKEHMPQLYKTLQIAEELRIGLLQIVETCRI